MRNQAAMQHEQQREAVQTAVREASRQAGHDLRQDVRQDATHGRELMSAAGREVNRRGDNLSEDARETFGPKAGAAVDKWLDGARDAMDRTQQAASSFFRLLEASLESAARQDQRLAEISTAATRALETFAAEMERQSGDMLRAVGEALDRSREQDAHAAIERSSEQTAQAREAFEMERQRLEAAVDAARVDQQRRQEQQAQMDDARRRDEETREREAYER